MRVASLDYLGIIAKRLRMDTVTSRLNEKTIESVFKYVCTFFDYHPPEHEQCSIAFVFAWFEQIKGEEEEVETAFIDTGENEEEKKEEEEARNTEDEETTDVATSSDTETDDENSRKAHKKKKKKKKRKKNHNVSLSGFDTLLKF